MSTEKVVKWAEYTFFPNISLSPSDLKLNNKTSAPISFLNAFIYFLNTENI